MSGEPIATSRFPFSQFPSGWYCVALVSDFDTENPRRLQYFDQEFVAFKGDDGEIRILDAFCPHLGAHLAVGGKVEGTSIRCPFHAWRFDGDSGICNEIPYAKRLRENVSIKTWPVKIWAGQVLMYFAEDESKTPRWDVDLPDCEQDWVIHSRREWQVRTHIQEIGENGLDVAHVVAVHNSPMLVVLDFSTNGPVMTLSTQAKDIEEAEFKGEIKRTLWGMGLSMNEFVGDVETRVIITRTPIDHEQVEVRMAYIPRRYDDENLTNLIGEAIAERVAAEFEGDIAIWENKAYIDSPVLCDGDGPIGKWRSWSKQFYGE